MNTIDHVPEKVLAAGLEEIKGSPKDAAVVDLIVRRTGVGLREVLDEAQLDTSTGLIGDGWLERGSSKTSDKKAHPGMQLTVMNSRLIALIAGEKERWPIAGDQLYVDLDLSATNLPTGARLKVGEAVIEITEPPHTGCSKFKERFGADALAFVNSPAGRELRLRGVHARIIRGGTIRAGAPVTKL
jgi:MOSC domain-containing protein YiiM